jgi:hypothetical protein
MNTGIEILLKRMETNPEEFAYKPNEGMSKWARLLDTFRHSLTKEEIDAVDEGLRNIERDRFTQLVMQTLAGVDETSEDPKSNPYLAPSATRLAGATQLSSITQSPYSNTSGTVTLPNGNITIGKTRLEEEQVKHMLAHLEWLKREESLNKKVEVNKKPLLRRIFK